MRGTPSAFGDTWGERSSRTAGCQVVAASRAPKALAVGVLSGAFTLLGPLRTEDRKRDRTPLRVVVALDALGDVVAQADGLGALSKAALAPLLDQRKTAGAPVEEVGRAGAVGQQR